MAGLILILAFFLRLINLNQSLWLDEGIQFKAVSRFSLLEFFTQFMPTDFNPPLSYLVNFGFSRIFGYSETALRLPSVIFGVITVWLVYKLGGKWPALLMATSGLHLYYSQEARMYSLAALAVTASFYFLKTKRWRLYILSSLAAIYSHYLTVFIFPAQFFWVKKKYWWWIVLGFLPWLPVFWRQLSAGREAAQTVWGGVVGGATLKNILLIPVKFLVGRISWDNNYLFALVLAVPLLAAAETIWQNRKERLWLSWLLVPTGLAVIVSWFIPVLAYFRLLFVLPAFYLLLKPSRIILVGGLIFNLITSGIYLFNPRFHREDWRGLARQLDGRPVVIFAAVESPLKYYWAGNNVVGTDTVPGQNFYYVAYGEDIFDPERNFRQKAKTAGFEATGAQNFRGNITLIEYRQ